MTTPAVSKPVAEERLTELVDSYSNATDVCDELYVTDLGNAINELKLARTCLALLDGARQCLGDTANVMESWANETEHEGEKALRLSYAATLRRLAGGE